MLMSIRPMDIIKKHAKRASILDFYAAHRSKCDELSTTADSTSFKERDLNGLEVT